jgi:hypothetical protein
MDFALEESCSVLFLGLYSTNIIPTAFKISNRLYNRRGRILWAHILVGKEARAYLLKVLLDENVFPIQVSNRSEEVEKLKAACSLSRIHEKLNFVIGNRIWKRRRETAHIPLVGEASDPSPQVLEYDLSFFFLL